MTPRCLPLSALLLPLLLLSSSVSSNSVESKWKSNRRDHVGAAMPRSHAMRHRGLAEQQIDIRTFEVLTSEQIHTTLTHLAETYPQFATLTDAQTEYGLPAAGTAKDCPFDRTDDFPAGCRIYILTIEDKVAHPDGSPSWQSLPEVFLSGALHGDERVGPTSVTEAASLLLEAAACEAMSTQDADPTTVGMAVKCRLKLTEKGVPDLQRKWLARLVTTRRIVIVPTANALGYYKNKRTEDGTDPNRDFPFDIKPENSDKCMQTIAGRAINEIFWEHMFQLSITFHAGMEAVTYEWGAPTYLDMMSPDDEAQAQIANSYSHFAGKFHDTPDYRTGTMNDVVYYVRGGMEDWAYAGSWDPQRVVQCTPKTYGGYPAEKTTYNQSTLRIFNMLVEASRSKTPRPNYVGTTEELLKRNGAGNGHISRNIRIALLAIDLVEPYVSILGADGVALADDIVPSSDRTGRACEKSKALLVPKSRGEIVVEWTVGGGFTVDTTKVIYGKWGDIPSSIDGSTHPTQKEWQSTGKTVASEEASVGGGTTRWHKDGANPTDSELPSGQTLGPVFHAKIDVSAYSPGDRIAVFAMARLDSSWSNQPDNIKPDVPPQSHVVNARTNPGWRHESSGKVIQGRFNWYSIPLTLVVGDDGQSDGVTVELSSRLNDVKSLDFGIDLGGGSGSIDVTNVGMNGHLMVATVAFGLLVLFVGAVFWRRHLGRAAFNGDVFQESVEFVIDGFDEEDEVFSSSYHDEVEGNGKGSVELSSYSDKSKSNGDDDEEAPTHTIT